MRCDPRGSAFHHVHWWVACAWLFSAVAVLALGGDGPFHAATPRRSGSSIANQSTVTLCYLYYGSMDDLGWTYSYNLGRLKAHAALRDRFPNRTITSRYVQNVALLSIEDRLKAIDALLGGGNVEEARCDVLMDNSPSLLNLDQTHDLARRYPDVFFALLNENQMTNTSAQSGEFDNVLFLANDFTSGFYAAGAAAGAQAAATPDGRSCIAFLAAWDSEVDPTSSFAGFLLGVRATNPTVPVHVISLDSWNDAEADRTLTKLFAVDHGCTIVARYTDPFAADQTIQSLALPGVFSIGPHANLQQYIGDSVLTAIFLDWSVALLGVLEPLLTTGRWDRSRVHFYGAREGAVQAAPLSPRSCPAAVDAFRDAIAFAASQETATGTTNSSSVICGSNLTLRTGHQLVPLRLMQRHGGTWCKIPWANLADFLVDDFVVAHPTFARGSSVCNPGESYRYAFTPLLSLICEPCPVGTYAPLPVPAAAGGGGGGCLPCPAGSTTPSSGGAAACVAMVAEGNSLPSRGSLSAGSISGVAVSAFLVGCVGVSMIVFVYSAWAPHRDAPSGERPLCLMWLDVEASQSLKRMLQLQECGDDGSSADKNSWSELLRVYETTVRSVLQRSGSGGAYESVHAETRFVIAFPSAFDALAAAVDLQEALMSVTTWPAAIRELGGGAKVRICLHHCLSATRSFDLTSRRFVYHGVDCSAGEALSGIALGGVIICAQDTLDAALQDPAYGLLLAHELTIHRWGVVPLPRSVPSVPQQSAASAAVDRDRVPLYRIVSKRAERMLHERAHTTLGQQQEPPFHEEALRSDCVPQHPRKASDAPPLLPSLWAPDGAVVGVGHLGRCSRSPSALNVPSPFAEIPHHAASSADEAVRRTQAQHHHATVGAPATAVVDVPPTRPRHSSSSSSPADGEDLVDHAIPAAHRPTRFDHQLPPGSDPELHQDCWSFGADSQMLVPTLVPLPRGAVASYSPSAANVAPSAAAVAAEGQVVQRLLQHVSLCNSPSETDAFLRQLCRALGLSEVETSSVPLSTRRVAAAAAARLNPGSLEAVIAAIASSHSLPQLHGGVGHNPLRSPRTNSLWSAEHGDSRRELSMEFPLIALSSALRPAGEERGNDSRPLGQTNHNATNRVDEVGAGPISPDAVADTTKPSSVPPLAPHTHICPRSTAMEPSDYMHMEAALQPSVSVRSVDVPVLRSLTPDAAPPVADDEVQATRAAPPS